MPGWTFPMPQLYAVFVSRQGMVPAVRAFVDYLVEMLDPDEGKHIMGECPASETRQQPVPVRAAAAIAS